MRVAIERNGNDQAERQKQSERQFRLADPERDEKREAAKGSQKRHGHSNEPTDIETDRRAKNDLGVGGIERIVDECGIRKVKQPRNHRGGFVDARDVGQRRRDQNVS